MVLTEAMRRLRLDHGQLAFGTRRHR